MKEEKKDNKQEKFPVPPGTISFEDVKKNAETPVLLPEERAERKRLLEEAEEKHIKEILEKLGMSSSKK